MIHDWRTKHDVGKEWTLSADHQMLAISGDGRVIQNTYALRMAEAYGDKPEVLKMWNQSVVAHGSNSSSLLSFTEYGGKKGELLPLGELERRGKIAFGGEVVQGRTGVNQSALSTTPIYRNDVLTHYSLKRSAAGGGWQPVRDDRFVDFGT